MLQNCKNLQHLEIEGYSTLIGDIAQYAPQLKQLKINGTFTYIKINQSKTVLSGSEYPEQVKLDFLLHKLPELESLTLDKCTIAKQTEKIASSSLKELAILTCHTGELSLNCPNLQTLSFESSRLKQELPIRSILCSQLKALKIVVYDMTDIQDLLEQLPRFYPLLETLSVTRSRSNFGIREEDYRDRDGDTIPIVDSTPVLMVQCLAYQYLKSLNLDIWAGVSFTDDVKIDLPCIENVKIVASVIPLSAANLLRFLQAVVQSTLQSLSISCAPFDGQHMNQ
jgi:hypothetical protein